MDTQPPIFRFQLLPVRFLIFQAQDRPVADYRFIVGKRAMIRGPLCRANHVGRIKICRSAYDPIKSFRSATPNVRLRQKLPPGRPEADPRGIQSKVGDARLPDELEAIAQKGEIERELHREHMHIFSAPLNISGFAL